MNKGEIAWLVRGYYNLPLEDNDDWQIIFEEPALLRWKEIRKVVLFEIE